jgi:hypothetical protein
MTAIVLQSAQQAMAWVKEHPEYVREASSWLRQLFTRSLPPVVFTGIKSAGKTVLWDFLSGAAYDEDYAPPDASADVEDGELKGRGKGGRRVPGIVIPGERGLHARQSAFERHFASKGSELSGLVYVVCAGLAKPRSSDAAAHLARQFPDLDSFVAAKLSEELADFDKTCHELESYWRKHRRPLWLLVVTTKADLYQDRLSSISDYYCPGGDGRFARRLEQLQNDIGRLNLTIDSAAVSCLSEDFAWGETTITSQLDDDARRAYVARLRARIHELCRA